MPARTAKQRDQLAELLWKWALRLSGLGAFFWVLIARHGDVPSALYVGIFGLIGLPNVIGWQKALRSSSEDPE